MTVGDEANSASIHGEPSHQPAIAVPLFSASTWSVIMERNEDNENAGTSVLRHFLYWIYERRLLVQIQKRSMPHHIGIVLDGNRRHARQRGLSDPCEIYRRGAEKLDDILDWCADLSVPAVTLWVFSTENRKRSPAEISGILAAIEVLHDHVLDAVELDLGPRPLAEQHPVADLDVDRDELAALIATTRADGNDLPFLGFFTNHARRG
jgi:hypothetical protein